MQERNEPAFYTELLFFFLMTSLFIGAFLAETYVTRWLQMRWRHWMTGRFLDRWMAGGTHFRLPFDYYRSDNPRPAYRRGHPAVHREHLRHRHQHLRAHGQDGRLRRHSLEPVVGFSYDIGAFDLSSDP